MRLSEAIRRTVNYNPNSIGNGRLFYGILSDQKPDWFDTNQQAFVHNICYDGRVAEIYDVLMTQDIEHIQSFQQYMIQEYNSSPREFYPIINAFAEGFGLPTVPQLIKMVKEQEQIEFERRQRQEMERQRKKEQEEKERKRKQRQENKERREREQEEKEQEVFINDILNKEDDTLILNEEKIREAMKREEQEIFINDILNKEDDRTNTNNHTTLILKKIREAKKREEQEIFIKYEAIKAEKNRNNFIEGLWYIISSHAFWIVFSFIELFGFGLLFSWWTLFLTIPIVLLLICKREDFDWTIGWSVFVGILPILLALVCLFINIWVTIVIAFIAFLIIYSKLDGW